MRKDLLRQAKQWRYDPVGVVLATDYAIVYKHLNPSDSKTIRIYHQDYDKFIFLRTLW